MWTRMGRTAVLAVTTIIGMTGVAATALAAAPRNPTPGHISNYDFSEGAPVKDVPERLAR